MERLLSHIRDLEREAENLTKQEHSCPGNVSNVENVLSFRQWVRDLKAKTGGWTAKPLVVLSLFDGIGGIWAALSLLDIPFVGYSCEVKGAASQVVKARFPMVRHVGDITALQSKHIPEKVDLIVGGFPCQDLTCLGHKAGLHGDRSKLFFEMLRIIKLFSPTWFLAENVASMAWQDRDEISKHLRTIPIEIDSQDLTPSKRKRIYWSNIPYPKTLPKLRDHSSTSLQSVLVNGTALNSKIGCILSSNRVKGTKVSLDFVMDNATCALRYVNVTEVEKAMGYPSGYTDVNFQYCDRNVDDLGSAENEQESHFKQATSTRLSVRQLRTRQLFVKTPPAVERVHPRPPPFGDSRKLRWSLLGNTFSVNVIAYLLSPLLERANRDGSRLVVLPKSIREQDCSAMDPGEVWALYNSQKRPNWYALIASRTGDRFDCTQVGKGKKSPVHVEVKFMEMTDAYAAEERDEWNAIRGTGLFQVRTLIDSQNSWISFSHRIDNFCKFDEFFFIFPAKDEVWGVYDCAANSCYLVYVVESRVDKSKAREGNPGQECFHARCRLMQLVETELYRLLDKEILYTELSLFAFKVPYVFRNESSLLKIDLTSRQRAGNDYVQQKRKRHRRGSGSGSEEDDDSQEDEEFLEEEAALADIMGGGRTLKAQENWQDCNDSPASGRNSGISDA